MSTSVCLVGLHFANPKAPKVYVDPYLSKTVKKELQYHDASNVYSSSAKLTRRELKAVSTLTSDSSIVENRDLRLAGRSHQLIAKLRGF